MAAESIGDLIPTAIPGYADAADIQAALRVYHYGSYSYNPANTSPGSLVSPSMAKTIYDIQQDIVDLENRPSSGGDVANTAPVPGDFTPSGIPNGYIWVDQDGTIGGQPISATAVFTASAPTSNLSTGVIWVDQDPVSISDNPFIATALISAKGDIIVGTANDVASVLNVAATNGYVLNVSSSTTSGLAWVDSAASTQTLTNKSIALGSNTLTGTIAQFNTAVTDADFATLAGTETLTNKTVNLSNNTLSGTISEFNTALSDADFATLAGTETLTNKTISGTNNTITNVSLTTGVTGTLPVANGGTGITFFGTGVATALGQNVTGSGGIALATSPTFVTPVLGTPTSGQLSNCTVDGTDSVGFRNTPINSQSAAYTAVLADAGKTILHPIADNNARTFTIPANSSVNYPIGTVISFVNLINTVTIAITSDTMYLANDGATGSRTLAAYGMASAMKVASTTWIISGNGLT